VYKELYPFHLNQLTVETIKQTLFTGWHLMRWLRLALGIFFIIQAIDMHDSLTGVVGGFFLFTAVTNTGCCGARSCVLPKRKNTEERIEEVPFDEFSKKVK
jgi:hypothetical protein